MKRKKIWSTRIIVMTLMVAPLFNISGQEYIYKNIADFQLTPIVYQEETYDIKGSPYYKEDFSRGEVRVQGKDPLEVYLRYNIRKENIEIKINENEEEIYTMPVQKETIYIFGFKKLTYRDLVVGEQRITGYFIEHYSGSRYELLEKPYIEITAPQKASTSYERDKPAKMKTKSEFLVVNNEGMVRKLRLKHRDVKRNFKSSEARRYLSSNRIRELNNFISFVSFLDQTGR